LTSLQSVETNDIIICLSIILGGAIGPLLLAKMFNFFALELMIITNLSISAMGGIGSISVAEVSERKNLLAFTQLSSRFAGTILLFVFAPFLKLLLNLNYL
jgi:Na+/citrate or Na+/malate symporter